MTILQENKHPPPSVPAGWQSSKSTVKASDQSAPYQSAADAAKASTLDPKARAAVLGEQQLPGKSIFDFLSSTARDKLAAATGKSNLPPALGEGAPAGFEQSETEKRRTLWDLVPPLDKQTAAAALHRGTSGWMPYAEDVDKRGRYRYFLELRAGLQSNLPERAKTSSTDEWAKELREFAQAAEVFKPISGLMASRFNSSSAAPKLASDAPDASARTPLREEDPAEKAAKLGMYGPLTRSRQPFYPTRLLCKRFNVKPPANTTVDPESGVAGAAGADGLVDSSRRLDVVSQASLDRMMREASFKPASFVSGGIEGEASVPVRQEPVKVDSEINVALEGQKAGDAVFKAIFGSDDEDDNE